MAIKAVRPHPPGGGKVTLRDAFTDPAIGGGDTLQLEPTTDDDWDGAGADFYQTSGPDEIDFNSDSLRSGSPDNHLIVDGQDPAVRAILTNGPIDESSLRTTIAIMAQGSNRLQWVWFKSIRFEAMYSALILAKDGVVSTGCEQLVFEDCVFHQRKYDNRHPQIRGQGVWWKNVRHIYFRRCVFGDWNGGETGENPLMMTEGAAHDFVFYQCDLSRCRAGHDIFDLRMAGNRRIAIKECLVRNTWYRTWSLQEIDNHDLLFDSNVHVGCDWDADADDDRYACAAHKPLGDLGEGRGATSVTRIGGWNGAVIRNNLWSKHLGAANRSWWDIKSTLQFRVEAAADFDQMAVYHNVIHDERTQHDPSAYSNAGDCPANNCLINFNVDKSAVSHGNALNFLLANNIISKPDEQVKHTATLSTLEFKQRSSSVAYSPDPNRRATLIDTSGGGAFADFDDMSSENQTTGKFSETGGSLRITGAGAGANDGQRFIFLRKVDDNTLLVKAPDFVNHVATGSVTVEQGGFGVCVKIGGSGSAQHFNSQHFKSWRIHRNLFADALTDFVLHDCDPTVQGDGTNLTPRTLADCEAKAGEAGNDQESWPTNAARKNWKITGRPPFNSTDDSIVADLDDPVIGDLYTDQMATVVNKTSGGGEYTLPFEMPRKLIGTAGYELEDFLQAYRLSDQVSYKAVPMATVTANSSGAESTMAVDRVSPFWVHEHGPQAGEVWIPRDRVIIKRASNPDVAVELLGKSVDNPATGMAGVLTLDQAIEFEIGDEVWLEQTGVDANIGLFDPQPGGGPTGSHVDLDGAMDSTGAMDAHVTTPGVYTPWEDIAEVDGAELAYVDHDVRAAEYEYRVRAADYSGNESADSVADAATVVALQVPPPRPPRRRR